jgi:hypothetical protein
MYLHIPTILFLTVLVALLTGTLLLFSWAQNRSHRSLALGAPRQHFWPDAARFPIS